MKAGKDQGYTRYKNNELILDLLHKRNYSATELAQLTGLSNASMTKILVDLSGKGLIKVVQGEDEGGKGRKRKYYAINDQAGLIVAIDFSDNALKVAFADMQGNILDRRVLGQVLHYTVAVLYEAILFIKDAIHTDFSDRRLTSVNLSLPGQIDESTMAIGRSAQFREIVSEDRLGVLRLFERHFDVPVRLYNDINLSAVAEKELGGVAEENFLLMHIDAGVGGAFYFGGKVFGGSHGFAGEIGFLPVVRDGKEEILDSVVSFTAIAERLNARCGETFMIDGLVRAYGSDPRVRAELLESAKVAGKAARELALILDIDRVIVSGKVAALDEEYKSTFVAASSGDGAEVRVSFSELEDSALHGAILTAIRLDLRQTISR